MHSAQVGISMESVFQHQCLLFPCTSSSPSLLPHPWPHHLLLLVSLLPPSSCRCCLFKALIQCYIHWNFLSSLQDRGKALRINEMTEGGNGREENGEMQKGKRTQAGGGGNRERELKLERWERGDTVGQSLHPGHEETKGATSPTVLKGVLTTAPPLCKVIASRFSSKQVDEKWQMIMINHTFW